MRGLLVVMALAACGGGSGAHGPADAGGDGTPADADTTYAACRKFGVGGTSVPVHITGTVIGADVESPATCATVDAPYGIESAGPDNVVRVDGLIVGNAYVVQLASDADFSFYVVTGCSTPTGPAASQCELFVDAMGGHSTEIGSFVARDTSAFVVVDYYASHAPNDPAFTLDVYAEQCATDAQCGGTTPVCHNGSCVQCETSFDCHDAAAPRCETSSHTCKPGQDQCLSDDGGEPANDGPAGAPVISIDGTGAGASSGQICSAPSTEADFIAFDVGALGEVWDIGLAWTGPADLDLALYDAAGRTLGLSYWEQPEHARLTYLPVGRYYAKVTEFSSNPDASPVPYTLSVQRTAGSPCTSTAQCAAEYRNQAYRGACVAGACVTIDGAGAVAEGGACDSVSDCMGGLSCPSFLFVANADTRDVCARTCAADADCAPLGAGYVCTTYLNQNFCVQKCTSDLQCPTAISSTPTSGPWYRLTCDLPTGRCQP